MSMKDFRDRVDAVYPEPLSRLHRITAVELHPQLYRRAVKKKLHHGRGRFRTQPVTFDEIQEVDEENIEEPSESSAAAATKSEQDLKIKFEEFSKSLHSRKSRSYGKTSTLLADENANTAEEDDTVPTDSPSQTALLPKNCRAKSRPSI